MADNINVTPGGGPTVRAVAADDVGGVLHQRVKMEFGDDGSASDVSATNPLPINQVSAGYDVSASFTRSANTTAYPANSVVGGAKQFASVGPNGGSVVVTGVQLQIDRSDIPAGMTTYRLYLYSATPPSALADNAAFTFASGDRASFLGFIDIDAPAVIGSSLYVEMNNIAKQVKLASADLFAYLVTVGGYTPASATPYKITLHTVAL